MHEAKIKAATNCENPGASQRDQPAPSKRRKTSESAMDPFVFLPQVKLHKLLSQSDAAVLKAVEVLRAEQECTGFGPKFVALPVAQYNALESSRDFSPEYVLCRMTRLPNGAAIVIVTTKIGMRVEQIRTVATKLLSIADDADRFVAETERRPWYGVDKHRIY